jgi:thioredoxin 1
MSNVAQGTDASFEEMVIKNDLPVIVDFWAPWCGPCRAVGPVLEQVASDYEGRAAVVKINVDEETVTASAMGVRSIPTIAFFYKGTPYKTIIGARPKEEITKVLDEILALG